MSELEKRWWFVGLMSAAAAMATILLFKLAHYPVPAESGHVFAQYLIFTFCIVVCQRAFSLVTWLVLVIVAPQWVPGKTSCKRQP